METITKGRSTRKEVKQAIKQHIFECVYELDESTQVENFEQARELILSEFKHFLPLKWERYNRSLQDWFYEYLTGLPFCFEYQEEEQRNILSSWGLDRNYKGDSEKVWRFYSALIFRELKIFID